VSSPRRTIVTAADHKFFRTLWQMLCDAARHGLERAHHFLVFDLGLMPGERHALATRFGWCEFRPFDFSRHPPHVRDLTIFAWKPLAVSEIVLNGCALALWLDSATLFRGRASLHAIFERVERHGVFALAGQTPLARCCDPRTLAWLRVAPPDLHKPYRAGGVLGFDGRREDVRDIVTSWRDAALLPDVIAPAGFDPRTHKFDQAIVTALLCRAEREGRVVLGHDEIDIGSAAPAPWISTRNKVAPWMPIALDPVVRAYYAVAKAVDRWVLRARRWQIRT
jgi:hypothetical protein